jgi:hypothetical protein
MCIACELGYWAMIDAVEADRASRENAARVTAGGFACEPADRQLKRDSIAPSTDEKSPPRD